MLRKDAWASVIISLGWLYLIKRTESVLIRDLLDRSLQGQQKKEPRGTIHPEHEGKVHPVTRTRLTSFYSHVDIINRYFTKKRRRGIKPFHFDADPRVRQEMVVGPEGSPTRRDFITVKAVAYIL